MNASDQTLLVPQPAQVQREAPVTMLERKPQPVVTLIEEMPESEACSR